jgi:hypothetical protein
VRGLLAALPEPRRRQFLQDLSYLNAAEIRTLCARYGIPSKIEVESADGGIRTTADSDRKPVVLDRLRTYLTTGRVPAPTRLPSHIVRDGPPPQRLSATDHLYYRWYNKTYGQVLHLLEELTDGRFRNGALARVLIMEYWTRGEAPTFGEFAGAWSSAHASGRDLVVPEYAFLTDLRYGRADADWKAKRARKAGAVLATLDQLDSLPS